MVPKAANQNEPISQAMLGMFYKHGIAVRQDYAKAKEWFGKSCDNGSQNGCDDYKKLNQR